ncbi:MAG: Mu homology domain-containing protein [Monoraphidium minutum]|nr:MAG: Mu homology domain-containing protein [Monoraphidium minutum]
MISQFFVLSPRGDVIIRRDYLGNVPKASTEIFFRNAKFYKGGGGEAPPVFIIDGVTYLHVKDGGVQLVACTRDNASPSFVLEFLKRISVIIKDYCGSLSEEAIRKNFVLIYELLDEVMDYGTPQSTSTELLKTFVLNEPTVVAPPVGIKPLFGLQKGPTGVFKSVLDTNRTDGRRRDEIFVDVVERLSMTFGPGGNIVSQQVDGAIQVKSYLAGNPPIKIKLNDDLLIAKRDAPYGGGGFGGFSAGDFAPDAGLVVLDDAYFHEAANLEAFDTERSISLVPPDGEFALLNYRTTHGLRPPFRLHVSVDPDPSSDHKALLSLRLFADAPADKAASGLEVEVPLPRYVQRVHCDADARFPPGVQSWEFNEKGHMLKWRFKKLQGGVDCSLKARLTLERPFGAALRTEVGPVNLRFTLPMYCASRLALKYLQILKRDKSYAPQRWVRYVTSSSSYIFRT